MTSLAKAGTSSRDLLRSIPDLPRHETERLLMVATSQRRADLLIGVDVAGGQKARFLSLAQRRRAGEPLQYLEGVVQFGPIELVVDARVLIPRPETEQLWQHVVDRLDSAPPRIIVDLCTGSGNLALALQRRFPAAEVLATDASADAVEVAKLNARRLRYEIKILTGDLFEPLPTRLRGKVDLVVANPPYLSAAEFAALPIEVRAHEPQAALVAGATGTEALERIAAEAVDWLRPGGCIACEIGEGQGKAAGALFSPYDARILTDWAGRDRFAVGTMPTPR